MFTISKPHHKPPIILSLFISGFSLLSGSAIADVISNQVSPDIQEPAGTYDQGALNVINMTVRTVLENGACIPGDYTGCTLDDVLNDTDPNDDFKPEVKVHMTADDFPDDGLVSNAKIRQRGATSRYAPQKSFRVKLDSKNDLWRGERRIQLLKSFDDSSRMRNKLSYDLMAEIPHLPSMRTQFIDFKINDHGSTENYGLYTQVEYFGKEYLQRRNWDKDSRVYKVETSLLDNDPGLAIDPNTGKPVDLVAFEKLMEIKRGKNHIALSHMIRDLNDPNIDFNTQIMGKYFNIDNYLSWFAVNILMNNEDTITHNFYLFNPKSNEHFYLIPWDYDATLGIERDFPNNPRPDQLPRWWFSHNNWADNVLHHRFLAQPGNLAKLKAAVTEIKNKYLTEAKISQKVNAYRSLIFPIISSSPDWDNMWFDTEAEYNRIINNITSSIQFNYNKFLERIDDPMPFYMFEPVFQANHDIFFEWTKSDSTSNQSIYYDLEVSTTKEFKPGTIIRSVTNINNTNYTLHWTHPKGTYYFRVRARDAANPQQHWQESTNEGLFFDNGVRLFGVAEMHVPTDGGTPPPSGVISNPVSSINIDGNNSEWSGLRLFANDPDDVPGGSQNVIDWLNAGVAHNSQNVYFMYKNRGNVDPNHTTGAYLSWGWQAFLDTDNNPASGYKYTNALGAEYLISGTTLYKYSGSGSDWNWTELADTNSSYNQSVAEQGFSRAMIGNPQSMRIVFVGTNNAFGGNTRDYYPDGARNPGSAIRYLSYSFGNTQPPVNHAPVANNSAQTVAKNTATRINLSATDADGDALSLLITRQPAHGSLTPSTSALFVQYTPDQNYSGTDSFKFRVNDGKLNSNIATVSINVADNPGPHIISNYVVNGGINVNGRSSDWNNLTLFDTDPDDIPSGSTNIIDWQQAGLAHSNDTIYLLYKNRGNVSPDGATGRTLYWGWQTYIDIDNSEATGFHFNSDIGADYLVEGRHIFKYTGSNDSWDWSEIGVAKVRYRNDVAELSFPRTLLSAHSVIKIAFFGNNDDFGGNTFDDYPDIGSFSYNFGSGLFGKSAKVSSGQDGLMKSPVSHKPVAKTQTPKGGDSKGGSMPLALLFISLLLMRNKVISRKA